MSTVADVEVAYVDAPELLYRLETDDLLQQVIPVVVLQLKVNERLVRNTLWLHIASKPSHTFPLGGLVNQRVQGFISGCLTLKLSGSWNTVTG